MAFFELILKEKNARKRSEKLSNKLKGIGKSGKGVLSVPAGGGDWNSDSKRKSIDVVRGVIQGCFEMFEGGEDYGKYGWASQLETLLGNAVVEQQMFDCKQGTFNLGQTRQFDQVSFDKICRTLTAMANRGPGAVGHFVIGVADNDVDAQRVEQLDGVAEITYKNFPIVGIEREAAISRKSLNDYNTWIIQKFRSYTKLDETLRSTIASNARLVGYHGRMVLVVKVIGQHSVFFFDGNLVDRRGSETVTVAQGGPEYLEIFRCFILS